MISQPAELPIVALSVRVYQALLLAYPTKFRHEYGSEMLHVFQDCCLRTVRQGGTNGMLRLWAVTLLDLIQSVISEHRHKEIDMSKSQLIKFSGWAFILGAFAFVTILSGSDAVAFPGSVISAILLAIGLSGLRARYGERAGAVGRNILRAGAIGIILFYMFLALLVLAVLFLPGLRSQAESLAQAGLWLLMFGGPAVGLLGLTLFGLTALHNKPMSKLNWLPAITGIWYPLVYLFLAAYLYTHNGVYAHKYHNAMQMMFLIQFVFLCVLGAIVAEDTPQKVTAA
jgi:hypothetical protein